ncbi:MAG: aromatic ring-hydroxylating dioxygenase subunit alpha [Tabrizicola sp.]|jgi:Rieske 2Fe-2S family protein|nr:aromatic ring-hydroxylating dioxygenase subunit alpha [Tabrizicola sp.]
MTHPATPTVSPRLDHCPAGLPKAAYFDPDWFERERATLFARQWIMVGRADAFPAGRMRRVSLAGASVIVLRDGQGTLAAWHNSCPHRGSELCHSDDQAVGALIRCPYHAFAYDATDGRLVATGHAVPTDDFDRAAHGLRPVALRVWNGFLFLSLAGGPGPIRSDVGLLTLDRWPMADLVTGHRFQTEVACNWKTFWENYSECLHCPGIHPALCDLVPVYRQGIMGWSEAASWTQDHPEGPNLRLGAESWTPTGAACGPVFPDLSPADRRAGYHFVTLWPSAYVVAHIDYVRSVRLEPVSPTRTRLVAEWHFAPATLAQPGFDAAEVAAFALQVLMEDGAAAEMNQRGMASPGFTTARLMPEEYEIHRFHQWVLAEMEHTP